MFRHVGKLLECFSTIQTRLRNCRLSIIPKEMLKKPDPVTLGRIQNVPRFKDHSDVLCFKIIGVGEWWTYYNFYYNILNIVSHSVLSCYEAMSTFEFLKLLRSMYDTRT